MILDLCNNGTQVFVASHSLFLLREIDILSNQKPYQSIPQRYFALAATDNDVQVEQGDTMEDLQSIVVLDEELDQSGRYMDVE